MTHSIDSSLVQSEILSGDTISITAAARRIGVDPATCWRWITSGVVGTAGQRVHLEAARLGCRWRTSEAALARFLATTNGRQAEQPAAPPSRDHARREREVGEATEQLRALGV